jgi:isochorismate synthase
MDTLFTTSTLTQEAYLDKVLWYALEKGFNFAVWRKPKANRVEIILDKNPALKKGNPQLDELPAGFIVHPFADGDEPQYYFLEAQEYFQLELTGEIETNDDEAPFLRDKTAVSKAKLNELARRRSVASANGKSLKPTEKAEFLEQVEAGINQIKASELVKIVPAKIKKQNINGQLDFSRIFLDLCAQYPNAFVNFIHSPSFGTWMGASPEVLIKTENTTFSTMALAGTQKAQGENPLKNAAWTQKEIEEQALVSRYIVNCFKKIRLREYEERGPKTILAGNLLHLRSDFIVDMEATNFPQLGSVMLELLHPTSAVCGMPRDKALNFIAQKEKFDRSLFAGYLGPVNIQDSSAIFVNLRTAQITHDHAFLYAGAGITEDSIPEKEWEETEMKCEIMGRFFTQENHSN